jgi:hypothetical protein
LHKISQFSAANDTLSHGGAHHYDGEKITDEELERLGCGSIQSYPKLIEIINAGVEARAKLTSNVSDLEQGMQDLLQRRFDRAPTVQASKDVSANKQKFCEEWQPCACGCGAMRKGDHHSIMAGEPAAPLQRQVDDHTYPVDAQAQKAYCARLSQPRKKPEHPVQMATPTTHTTRVGKPNFERLECMAQPRKQREEVAIESDSCIPTAKLDKERLDQMAIPRLQSRLWKDLPLQQDDQIPMSLGSDSPSRPVRRSFLEQRKYTQSRLHPKPTGRPGSIAALQMKLDSLLQERRSEEAQLQNKSQSAVALRLKCASSPNLGCGKTALWQRDVLKHMPICD